MMNPQYLPPGQNNNAPNNPIGFPPTSQDYNGVQNANVFSQNGQQLPKPFDQGDVTQKIQSLNLNGPQGFPPSQLPPGQLPPGQAPPGAGFPPSSNFGSSQFPSGRPPVSGAPQQFPLAQKPQLPPSSAPGMPPGFNQIPSSQAPNMEQRPFPGGAVQPPTSATMKPLNQPGVIGQSQAGSAPMSSQPGPIGRPGQQPSMGGLPQQPQMGGPQQPQLGGPSQQPTMSGPQQTQIGGPQQQQMGGPPQPQLGGPPQQTQLGGPPQQSQLGGPPQSQMGGPQQSQMGGPPQQQQIGGLPQQPQMGGPPQSQMGGPQQPKMGGPPQQPQLVGLPQQPQMGGPPHSQMGGPNPQFSGPNISQAQSPWPPGPQSQGLPQQPNQGLPPQGQPGLPSHPGMPRQLGQPGLPPQPGLGQTGQMPPMSQPGLPPMSQSGPMGQPGQLSRQPGNQPGFQQPGLPPQPGKFPGQPQPGQQGLPPQPGQYPGQSGLPPQPGQFSQQPGLPPQPGQFPQQPGLPPQPGQMSQGLQQPAMPGLPHMPPPTTQQRYPGQPGFNQPPQQQPYHGMAPSGQQPGYQYQPPFPQQQPSYPDQQPRKLDPDNMPSPIQVMLEDQQNRGGVFITNEKGAVPPLVSTDFVVDDRGNASPRYIRSSMYSVPVTADLLKQTALPFCLVISPMAEPVGTEQDPPLLDFAALTGSPHMGPVRCSRCKAYICPNMKFIDAGRHFKCAFCKATTEVPMEYTQYINSMQQYNRMPAEMALGAYELVATKEYCRNNTLPNPPALVFVIDVSYNANKSGLVQAVCDNILSIIEELPKDEQTGKSITRVGFITYSSTVHFYNIKGSLAQPQMLSVGDVADVFVPLLEGFLVTAEESGAVLTQLLQQIPAMFQDNKETETILLPAVQAGYEALKAADTAGQLIVFHTTLPSYNAPGKLINREDRKLLGTDKEKQILNPATTAYNELGQLCSAAGVSVELFSCNNAYVDLATLGQLARLTGGQLHKYTYFTADTDGARVMSDVRRALLRATAHDAVMRVRTSTGVRATDFLGHLYMCNTSDVELASVDADKGIGIEIKHDDKLTGEDGVYIQAALLYTHRTGQRRLRVLNLALNVAHQLADVYRSVDTDTVVNFLTKQAVWALREHPPRQVREALSSRCAKSLACYRRHCASPSSAAQLVLPESMKLLPLYTACALRGDAICGGPDITCDERACAMSRALCADVPASLVYTYPRLLALHGTKPTPLRASMERLADTGLYLLENGVHMLLWIGANAPPDLVRGVFGVTSAQLIDPQVAELPVLDTPQSEAVRGVIEDARRKRRNAMRLTIMRQHDKLETVLRHFLVEDRGVDGSASYVDYLCYIHKEIRALL